MAYIIKDERYAAGGWYQPVDNSEQVSILKSVVFVPVDPWTVHALKIRHMLLQMAELA